MQLSAPSRICTISINFIPLANTLVSIKTTFCFGKLMQSTEQFCNGITIISPYLNPLPNSKAPPIEHSIMQVVKEASLLYCLPDNPFFVGNPGAPAACHAVQEATYACTYMITNFLYGQLRWTFSIRLRMDFRPALLQSPWPSVPGAQERS